jgi:hypothetical protein
MSRSPALVLAFLVLPGCADVDHAGGGRAVGPEVAVPLVASARNAGEVGQAVLIPAGPQTRVALTISGVPTWTSLPVHVYTSIVEGGCEGVSDHVLFALNDRVLPDAAAGGSVATGKGPFMLSHLVNAPLDELVQGGRALVLRTAPADGGEVIFCGALRRG